MIKHTGIVLYVGALLYTLLGALGFYNDGLVYQALCFFSLMFEIGFAAGFSVLVVKNDR